jgi:hypothetical protein
MAKLIIDQSKEEKLKILEVGSGTGVFADTFLDYFKYKNFSVYQKINY